MDCEIRGRRLRKPTAQWRNGAIVTTRHHYEQTGHATSTHTQDGFDPMFVFSNTVEHGTAPAVPFSRPDDGPSKYTTAETPLEDSCAFTMLGAFFRPTNATRVATMYGLQQPRDSHNTRGQAIASKQRTHTQGANHLHTHSS